ncbi:MAG: hypothetical protein A2566_02900 [Candidatus Zambryskibacteria bacterium RIFOXYD1_FULL_40_13]|nr:MAG: Peptidase M50 [Parcubacteria group bacterium GW2011_GWC1_39_12]KKR19397.1 MAG: Peptidase M50 [Parcubacteria group bacterium GW2011_GWF1_39_37]KKR35221.1 MAG: Peptidase M50 [Parcubacteria group bacterium GW2011_GWC2_40_10]KKR52346.1 MAG: Peptidase M50 [Parcubacteria group bacterium GW2011_GWE1_40_20]KKR65329.1 MAG: Peptidase M50 [Parcubacteria group bacterium GW2011_GWB1_40_5]KKR69390.1 MAG: Peptidase M50 [Parcubacteria group bacterium GW2011_GWF2_40_69]KKR82002.1 MAG: Peptidase M50 [P
MSLDFIFSILILIFSVVIHEVSHGYAAYLQGDNTARFQGRLTLNPLKHLEWFGSFILPTLLAISNLPIIGWAKPVPFNPYNLRNQRWGEAIVALAGPLSNICIAVFFGLLIRFGISAQFGVSFVYISSSIVLINLVLATFNLIPIPPLDGSKILFSFLPYHMQNVRNFLERNGTLVLIFFIFFLLRFLWPVVLSEYSLITGIAL